MTSVSPPVSHVSRVRCFGVVLLPNLLLGVPVYFIAFFLAYALQGAPDVGDHRFFLQQIVGFAVVCGLIALPFLRSLARGVSLRRRLAYALSTSLALNLTAVGVGSIVSALNKDQGSVSADFSPTVDVLLAGGLFGAAAVCAAVAVRALR